MTTTSSKGRRIDDGLLARALYSARIESTTETETHLAAFEFAAHRAMALAAADGAIADEVEAVVVRHAPSFLDQYVTARRRATANQIGELEASLKRTVDILAERLRRLVDTQSSRDVEHVGEHEAFLRQRHGEMGEALA